MVRVVGVGVWVVHVVGVVGAAVMLEVNRDGVHM